jgi:hypothetical protein
VELQASRHASPSGDGIDRRREDRREAIEDPCRIGARGNGVAPKPRPREDLRAERRIAIDRHDPVDEVVERRRIVGGEKARGVEVASYERVAPVDGDRVDEHRLEHLLGGVSGEGFILEGNREPAVGEERPPTVLKSFPPESTGR